MFYKHRTGNYASLEPDIAYLSSLRDMLIVAKMFPKFHPSKIVLDILHKERHARAIPDMIKRGTSPVNQFKLIYLDEV